MNTLAIHTKEKNFTLSNSSLSINDILLADCAGRTLYLFVHDINEPLKKIDCETVSLAKEAKEWFNENLTTKTA